MICLTCNGFLANEIVPENGILFCQYMHSEISFKCIDMLCVVEFLIALLP
jgi:hypothetical protein